ncbi:hypothetical protein [Stygiolobus caldivivus]|uniref:Uncharacterized protein n=1 Tax=Stygiolobus caldivivus TaxID=2824673 RepID=A0A8D5U4Z0_9CREN|nr:hypothetical protein [Stygiolobus caldivivus]BCU69536.1 hypothetical protein KN1_08330 [Stygiolobus caldivivus]
MKELFDVLEEYLTKMIQHYATKIKAIVIGGSALESEDINRPLFVVVVIEGVKRISFLARQEIIEYFIKKLESEKVYSNYVISTGHRPLIYSILVDPLELEYHIPIISYVISKGRVIIGDIQEKKFDYLGTVLKMGEVNKGDVVDL